MLPNWCRRRPRCRFSHFRQPYGYADPLVGSTSSIVFCGNYSPKMCRFCAVGIGQTNRQTYGTQHRLMPPALLQVGDIITSCYSNGCKIPQRDLSIVFTRRREWNPPERNLDWFNTFCRSHGRHWHRDRQTQTDPQAHRQTTLLSVLQM